MTISVNGDDISQIFEIAGLVGGILATLLGAFIFYLLVRPPRHVRQARKQRGRDAIGPEMEGSEREQVWQLMDRMETRLEVLERAMLAEEKHHAIGAPPKDTYAPAESDRTSGRN